VSSHNGTCNFTGTLSVTGRGTESLLVASVFSMCLVSVSVPLSMLLVSVEFTSLCYVLSMYAAVSLSPSHQSSLLFETESFRRVCSVVK